MKNRKVKIAVIGTGRMGSVHVQNIVRLIPESDLAAICDIRLEVAQPVADELGIQRVVRDYHELLKDQSIEAVLIATSTNTHAFIVKDVAAAGKQIFCEKPLALGLAEIDDPCYVDEVRQFVECVRDDKPTPTTGADGRAAVVLGYAAGKSLHENRPVKVSEIG
ncbi:MAG: Gfo/Idh/MocA family oxidoreductase [Anaerolineales bacterium]|nr:Gfo/Idh/MocA family oxidoreductase [Anaerolineales bacterium]